MSGCTDATPLPSATVAQSPDATPTASATESATADLVPEPGRPFEAADILLAMRESRRPGGVPQQLQTDEIARLVAYKLWTFTGEPWMDLVIGGSCGPETCTLEVAGRPEGAAEDDLYVFTVTPATPTVEITTTELRGLTRSTANAVVDLLHAVEQLPDPRVAIVPSVRWLPPPDEGRYVVTVRSETDAGGCAIDYAVDAVERRVVSTEVGPGC